MTTYASQTLQNINAFMHSIQLNVVFNPDTNHDSCRNTLVKTNSWIMFMYYNHPFVNVFSWKSSSISKNSKYLTKVNLKPTHVAKLMSQIWFCHAFQRSTGNVWNVCCGMWWNPFLNHWTVKSKARALKQLLILINGMDGWWEHLYLDTRNLGAP